MIIKIDTQTNLVSFDGSLNPSDMPVVKKILNVMNKVKFTAVVNNPEPKEIATMIHLVGENGYNQEDIPKVAELDPENRRALVAGLNLPK